MHRTKITAFIALAGVSAALFFLSSSPLAKARDLKPAPLDPQSVTAKFLNIGGMTLQAGHVLNVKWLLEGEGVRYFETNPWSECELFFSADAGKTWARVTPQFSVTRRDFDWYIPNVSAETCILALHIGIEGEGEYFSFPSATFSIFPGKR